jgi:hypothetical protein
MIQNPPLAPGSGLIDSGRGGSIREMTKDDFQKMQYEALRQEILSTQQRSLQTLGFGALSVPATTYLAEVHNLPALSLTIPLLILGIALLYLADNHGITRCGAYIREHIEKDLNDNNFSGWETWLESEQGRRSTERYTTWGFYLLFLLYFLASVFLAWKYVWENVWRGYQLWLSVCAVAFYLVLGVAVGRHIVRSLRLGTTYAEKKSAGSQGVDSTRHGRSE